MVGRKGYLPLGGRSPCAGLETFQYDPRVPPEPSARQVRGSPLRQPPAVHPELIRQPEPYRRAGSVMIAGTEGAQTWMRVSTARTISLMASSMGTPLRCSPLR